MDPRKPIYRYLVLFFNCLLTFGTYYCFDMPSVLQDQFQQDYHCNRSEYAKNVSCCDDCLGMAPDDYNWLYTVYAWMNAVVVIATGFFIDKIGNRVSVLLFSSIAVVGSSIFALGASFRGESALLPVMLLGRLLFGAANGSLTIVQNRITAFWFTGKELALAFGVTLTFSRLGSVLNFLFTSDIYSQVGLKWTLWIGAMLCGVGIVAAIIVSFLDIIGMRKLGQEANIAEQSRQLRITDIRFFSLSFWLVALTIMFFYNGIFPFVADASEFIIFKYGYDRPKASITAGGVYYVSMVLSPFLGGIIDIFGKRGLLAISSAVLTIPVFVLLGFTYVPPYASTVWLGVTYSVAAASLWPSIPLVVPQATIGTAMGLTTSLQMLGVGISNVIVGEILGKKNKLPRAEKLHRWKYVMIYLLANALASVVAAVWLNIVNQKAGGILNLSRQQLREELGLTVNDNTNSSENSEEEEKENTANDSRIHQERDLLVPKTSVIS